MIFGQRDVSQVLESGRMPLLVAETSSQCLLDCLYCYRKNDKEPKAKKGAALDISERIRLIQDAARLGAKAYHIVGAGEPLCDPCFPEQLKEANRLGMEIMVATDGTMLRSKRFLDMMERFEASVFLKLNSFSEEVERGLVGKKGYAKKRNTALIRLIERGFNREEKGESGAISTRLAIDCMITESNLGEALDILRFCRLNNISPFMTTFIPVGRGSIEGRPDLESELADLFRKAKEQDLDMGFDDGNAGIYLGGQECNQRGLGPYININGEARVCVGEKDAVGNILEESLENIWTRIRKMTSSFLIQDARLVCPPRENATKARK